MQSNNSINYNNYKYYFCYKLSVDQIDVTGDGTNFQVPMNTIVSDAWGMCAGGVVTLPVRGIWIVGGSVCYTANFASFSTGTQIANATASIQMIVDTGSSSVQKISNYAFASVAAGQLQTEPGEVIYMIATGSGGTKTMGVLGTNAFPTMMWGYCLAETPAL